MSTEFLRLPSTPLASRFDVLGSRCSSVPPGPSSATGGESSPGTRTTPCRSRGSFRCELIIGGHYRWPSGQLVAIPMVGEFCDCPPLEPRKVASPKLKMPPSVATIQ